ncbi:MAG: ATP-binding protein [Rhodoferax sp.]|nr:ATP-binding protein [Rhodoferax sp.]
MVDSIAGWLDDQMDGATIFGPSRFGKSSAVDHWLQQLLAERHGGYVPMVVWSHIDSGGSMSVGRFYANLLDASQHPLAKAVRSPLDRQHMLIEKWISMAALGNGRFLVLVIDEAQSMTQREWIWLVELHSTLEKQRIRLCVFSIASLQFFDEPIGMALSGGSHVAARFMLASKPFHGVRSVAELGFVMRGYDYGTSWPARSGISYTAGLAPDAWSDGFRMEDQADALMTSMAKVLGPNYNGPLEFPMKTVSHASRHVLLRIAGGANWQDVTSAESWQKIVADSGHKSLMAIVSASASKHKRTGG